MTGNKPNLSLDDLRALMRNPERAQEAEELLVAYASELDATKRDLVEAREAAASATRVKTEFLSHMSHELRTPLNAIIGMSEVLWDSKLCDEQRKLLGVLRGGGRNLLTLVNDILDLSRLESQGLQLKCQRLDLIELVSKIVETMRPLANLKGLNLSFDYQDGIREVLGDPQRLEQVLVNLLGNAIKFTEHGSVDLFISRSPNSNIHFTVRDTGIGLDPAKLQDLFNSFTQLGNSLNKRSGGIGVGLAICKQLVQLMHGSIWVESEFGVGTTFHVTAQLPDSEVRYGQVSNESNQPQSSLKGIRILLAEDSDDNALLIRTYLKDCDCTIDRVVNGREAISQFGKRHYDLILMDVQMPEMDGYSATQWIRVLETSRERTTPIVALTAFAYEEDVRRSLNAGCDAHLNKPITKSTLVSEMTRQLTRGQSA